MNKIIIETDLIEADLDCKRKHNQKLDIGLSFNRQWMHFEQNKPVAWQFGSTPTGHAATSHCWRAAIHANVKTLSSTDTELRRYFQQWRYLRNNLFSPTFFSLIVLDQTEKNMFACLLKEIAEHKNPSFFSGIEHLPCEFCTLILGLLFNIASCIRITTNADYYYQMQL